MSQDEFTLALNHPCTVQVVGMTNSGKTTLVSRMIKERETLFSEKIQTVIYVYKLDQPLLQELRNYDKTIIFTQDISEALGFVKGKSLMILDDQLTTISGEQNQLVNDLFTVGSHHLSCSLILISQALFGRNLRLISINTVYLIILKSPRDKASIINLGKQFCPNQAKYISEAYRLSNAAPYSHIFFDFSQQFPEKFRVRSSVFYDQNLEFYVQSDENCEG